jgi:DNA helicase II / ATP-dependent DNA helicase PcrA
VLAEEPGDRYTLKMQADETLFNDAYQKLNTAQKRAVDTVEGPVMVIAGPGTGKTHILTLRIANILRQTHATPDSILALTFTESAARTVRARLSTLIGEKDARKVAIHTFHGFCDFILSEYSHFFPEYVGRRLAGDVESTLLWREVLDTENAVHLSPAKKPYHYLRPLERLAQDLARERLSLAEYRAWADEEVEKIKKEDVSYYTRDSKYGNKGDLRLFRCSYGSRSWP